MAAIAGLEELIRPCSVTLHSDSRYLVDTFEKGWIENWQKKNWKTAGGSAVKNVDLWKRLLTAMEPHDVRFVWVKGHDGDPHNERCDALATSAADGDDLSVDAGFKEEES